MLVMAAWCWLLLSFFILCPYPDNNLFIKSGSNVDKVSTTRIVMYYHRIWSFQLALIVSLAMSATM
jgi:hypothetical protein